MSLGMILIGGTPAARVLGELAAFATRPENWYEPDAQPPPGDRPGFARWISCVDLVDRRIHEFRVVFSVTRFGGTLHRHASISQTGTLVQPSPLAVFTICSFLGFDISERLEVDHHEEDVGVTVAVQEFAVPA